MTTAVFFHAHPDDEAIATAGTMIRAADAGHRIVVVSATDGALGEPAPGSVPPGVTLAEVRLDELRAAAEIIGAGRVEWLGYGDSGMEGEPTNDDPSCFWQADVDAAAHRLAAILREEGADLLTVYDERGNYGHPDHIQVHRVGVRAAAFAGVGHVFEATMNRDAMRALADLEVEGFGPPDGDAPDREELRETEMGTPADELTHAVDVTTVLDRKRAAMAAHRSQITPESWFMTMPQAAFGAAFGTEWYVERGAERSGEPFRDDLFASLARP